MSDVVSAHGIGSAAYSPDRKYRYHLRRELAWQPGLFQLAHEKLVVIMLNPSTATETDNDPTVRRMIGFAERERCGALEVLNVYSWRATDRRELLRVDDPVGPENDQWIIDTVSTATLVVAAWGAYPYESVPGGRDRVARVVDLVRWNCTAHLSALHVTKHGFPGHPLYLPGSAALRPWP